MSDTDNCKAPPTEGGASFFTKSANHVGASLRFAEYIIKPLIAMAAGMVKMLLLGMERFAYSESTKPLAERIIKTALPLVSSIDWMDANELDVQHGIDVIARCRQGQALTFQVKFLSQDYRTVCIESTSVDSIGNPKQADWQGCLAQFIFVAYSLDGSTVKRWAIVDNARLAMASNANALIWRKRSNNHSHSEFRCVDFSDIKELAPQCIVACGGDWA